MFNPFEARRIAALNVGRAISRNMGQKNVNLGYALGHLRNAHDFDSLSFASTDTLRAYLMTEARNANKYALLALGE